MSLYLILKAKKILRFIIILTIFAYPLQSTEFIDIDKFNFPKTTKSGLRICTFNLEKQQYAQIKYYIFPTGGTRQPTGILTDEFAGLNIKYSGDIEIMSPLKYRMVRTTGALVEKTVKKKKKKSEALTFMQDDQDKNLAFYPLRSLNPDEIMISLNEFEKAKSKQGEFTIYMHTFNQTEWSTEKVTFSNICNDTKNNSDERGLLGELATRMAFFSYGYLEKFVTQDGSNQGLDGAYTKRNGEDECIALFLTESKCQNKSQSTKNVMNSQLTEEVIYNNINRINDQGQKSTILDFIKQEPKTVFKCVHRILPSGHSEWLIETINTRAFCSIQKGIASPEKDKKYFIEGISANFRGPDELLRVTYDHYDISSDQDKLRVFLKATGFSTEYLTQLMSSAQPIAKPRVARRLFPIPEEAPNSESEEEEASEKQESVDVPYSRENLSSFLQCLKNLFPRVALQKINEGLKKEDSTFCSLTHPQLTMFSNYTKYKDKLKKYDYEPLWALLKTAFSDEYQQAIADQKIK